MLKRYAITILIVSLSTGTAWTQLELNELSIDSLFPEQLIEYEKKLTDSAELVALNYLHTFCFSLLQKDIDKSIRAFEWMLLESKKYHADSLRKSCLDALKFLYRGSGQYEKSIDATRELNSMDANFYNQNPLWNNSMGLAYYGWGKLDSAQFYFKKFYQLSRSVKDTILMSRSANNLGLLYNLEGAYEFAIQYFLEALSLSIQQGDNYSMAYNQHNLGSLFFRMDNINQSRNYLDSAYEISVRNNYTVLAAKIRLTKGKILLAENSASAARNQFEELKDIFLKNNQKPLVAETHILIAKSYLLDNQPTRASHQISMAHQILDQIDNLAIKAEHQLASAEVYLSLNKSQLAIPILWKAKKYAESQNRNNLLLKIYDALINTFQDQEDWKQASQLLLERVKLKDDLDIQTQANIVYEMQTQQEQLRKDQEIANLKIIKAEEENKARLRLELNIALIALLIGVLCVLGFTYLNLKRSKLIAYQEKELHQQQILVKEQEKSLAVMKALVEGQEEERKRISTDLHDGLGTLLASMRLKLQSLDPEVHINGTGDKIKDIEEKMVEAYEEIRRISHDMMPEVLTNYGLLEATQNLCDQIQETSNLHIDFHIVGDPIKLNGSYAIMVYHIFQELLNNVIKHAQASHVDVQISFHANQVSLMVEDDGIGFDKITTNLNQSLGLRSIASRVEYLKGSMDIDSTIGRGTAIIIHFPLYEVVQTASI